MPKKQLIRTEKLVHQPGRGGGFVKNKDIFATYPNICKKCGYGKAEIIDEGVKYSDEDEKILLKCGKCSWAERINKKTS